MAAKKPLVLSANADFQQMQSGDFTDIPQGGTGATTASGALTSLGAAPVNNPTFTGVATLPSNSSAPGLLGSANNAVAAAGSVQGTATLLTADTNVVTSSTAVTAIGVIVPNALSGKTTVIENQSTNTIQLYPASGHKFDSLSVNTPIAVPVGGLIEIYGTSSSAWITSYNSIVSGAFIIGNIAGNAATSTTTTNIVGGSAGGLPYQTGASTTTILAATTNGYVLTLSGGLPVWAASTGGVTSFSAGTTGFTPNTGSTGPITLAGTLNVANGGTGVTSSTGSGSVVLSNTPTLITPNIGAATGSSLTVTGQLSSSISTGTAPFVVSSTTNVANLNASSLNGATFAAPGAIGGGTASTASFTTVTATTFTGALSGNATTAGTVTTAAQPTITSVGTLTGLTVSGTLTATLTGHATLDLPLTGGTMSGSVTFSSGTVTGLATPSASTDAATKAYVDAAVASLAVHDEVAVTTTTALSVSYSNGASGVGATLTNAGTQAALILDGISLVVGNRVLVKNQATTTQNGIYVVTNIGSGSTNWVLTRASDADNSKAGEFSTGLFVFVQQGTSNASTGWTLTSIGTGVNDAITIGTDAVTFSQFSGAGTYLAGTGLLLTGNTFSNTGVLSITGTVNQITASASTGAITLSLPQNINSGAAPTFAGTNFTAIPNVALSNSSITIGGTGVVLGGTITTISGLTSIAATTFTGALSGNATTATTTTNIAGGSAGGIVYQTGSGATGFSAAGTSGYVLLSGGAGVPTWASQSSLTLTSGQVTSALTFTPENIANKGVASGYASLDGSGKVPSTQLPSSSTPTQVVTTATNNTGSTMVIGATVYSDTVTSVQLANGGAVGTSLVVGLNSASVASAGTATIVTGGVLTLTTTQWDVIAGTSGGLVYGTNYFLSSTTAGNITSTLPTAGYVTRIGIALNTTTMLVRIGDRVQL